MLKRTHAFYSASLVFSFLLFFAKLLKPEARCKNFHMGLSGTLIVSPHFNEAVSYMLTSSAYMLTSAVLSLSSKAFQGG